MGEVFIMHKKESENSHDFLAEMKTPNQVIQFLNCLAKENPKESLFLFEKILEENNRRMDYERISKYLEEFLKKTNKNNTI
jgi:protein involved in ribonucleotide reduction